VVVITLVTIPHYKCSKQKQEGVHQVQLKTHQRHDASLSSRERIEEYKINRNNNNDQPPFLFLISSNASLQTDDSNGDLTEHYLKRVKIRIRFETVPCVCSQQSRL